MERDHLAFTCPRCGVNLVVPASAAGIEGPCPKCGGLIRAPRPDPGAGEIPVRLDVREEPVVKVKPVAGFQPAAQQPIVESTAMISKKKAGLRRWILTIAIFLCVLGVLGWFFAEQLNRDQPDARLLQDGKPPPAAREEQPREETPEIDPLQDPRVPPEGLDIHEFVRKSAEVLGAFLVAPGLDERLPLLETITSREDLAKTVLAGPLPNNGNFESLEVKFDKVLGSNEVIFKTEFIGANGLSNSYLILVRTRGSQDPKIVVEPFLDTYGGRLAAFAAAPREGPGKFQVVGTFFDFCSDEAVPGYDLKCTMKISTAPGTPDLAKAYFAKSSPLRAKLERLRLRLGHGSGVTATLQWNTTATPFIEVVDVTSLNWNE